MRGFVTALLCTLIVAACGSKTDEDGVGKTLFDAIKAQKKAKAAEKAAEGKPKPATVTLTRAAIAHVKTPFLRIDAQASGFITLYSQIAQNGDYRTYLNNSKMSVTFNNGIITANNGIITATRGFGLDLLSQGASISSAEMFVDTNGPISYTRTQQQLTRVKQVAEIDYNCILEKGDIEAITIVEIEYQLAKFKETCRNSNRAFKNFYWVDPDTQMIWKSAQSIGQQAGYFITEVLVE